MTQTIQPTLAAPASPGPTHERLGGFDGLRAMAAGLVLVCHLALNLQADHGAGLFGWVPDGGVAVFLFFAMSGFLMGYLIMRERQAAAGERGGRLDFWYFLARRGVRIVPPAVVYVAVIAAGSWAGVLPHVPWKALAGAATLLINYVPGASRHDLVGHYWSLGLEVQFYVLVAVLNAAMPARWVSRVMGGLVVAVLVGRYGLHVPGMHDRLFRSALFLFAGYGVGSAWVVSPGLRAAAGRVPFWPVLAVWWWAITAGRGVAGGVAMEVLFPVASFGLLLSAAGHGWGSRAMDARPVRWLGERSYGLYIWQQVFTFPPGVTGLPVWVCVAGAVVMAHVSFVGVERPLNRGLRRWWGKRGSRVAAKLGA